MTVQLKLPREARVIFNSLHRSKHPARLTQDLLGVALSDGKVIDVSWHPEYDPDGAYTITVFSGAWDRIHSQFETKDIDAVIEQVESFAKAGPIYTWRDDPETIHVEAMTNMTAAARFSYA